MPLLIFLVLFIGIPVAEIALLIQVGGLIGVWATIAAILATAVIGTFLIRYQGLQVISQAQRAMQSQQVPVDPVIHGIFLLLAGAFLLTPGFITDFIGFLCLVPQLRLLVAGLIWSRIQLSGRFSAHGFSTTGFHQDRNPAPNSDTVIDGEFTSIPPGSDGDPDKSSPWTKKE